MAWASKINIMQGRKGRRVDMGMVGAYNFIAKRRGFTLNVKILLMGNLKALLLAIIEAVPAGSNLIDRVLDISPVITILYSDQEPATFIGQLPKCLLLDNLELTPG
jgi:hypothetical protein